MYGSGSCNIKYNPGYVAIDTIKKNHTNKTNLVKKISEVKIKPHTTPVSNQSFEVPFLMVNTGERVYVPCEMPDKQSFPKVKFLLTLSAVMLISGGAIYGVNRALRSGGGAVNGGNLGMRPGPSASGTEFEAKHLVAHPIAPKSDNLVFDINAFSDRGFRTQQEGKTGIGVKAINDYNQGISKKSSPPRKLIFGEVKLSINKDILQVLSDFDETIDQNNKWLNTANSHNKPSIQERINKFEAARDEVQQLRKDINNLEMSSRFNIKLKAKALIILIGNFRQKYDYVKLANSVSSETPLNMFSLSQSLDSRIARLQKLTG